MKQNLLAIYTKFNVNNRAPFFDGLVAFVGDEEVIFSKYISRNLLIGVENFKASDYILGHSDDFFEAGISYYIDVFPDLNDRQKCEQVIALICRMANFMITKICPSCKDTNLILYTPSSREQIYEFCEECLYIGLDGEYIEVDEELFPANRRQVEEYGCEM